MSEPIKPFDSLSDANAARADLRDLRDLRDHDSVAFDLDDSLSQPTTARGHRMSLLSVRSPRRVQTLTNSPNCAPESVNSAQNQSPSPDRPPIRRARGVGVNGARSVQTDAWAVPASANWSRTRKTVRKVNRTPRSTDWALPF